MRYLRYITFVFYFVGQLNLTAQTFRWAQRATSSANDNASCVKADNKGNVIVTGLFNGIISFDSAGNSKTLTSSGSKDIYLAKLNCSKNQVWRNRVGGTGGEGGLFNYVRIDIANNGDILLTGTYAGTATFTSQDGNNVNKVSSGGTDIFLARYDSTGILKWIISSGSNLDDEGTGVYINNTGEILVSGLFRGNAVFGTLSGSTINKSSVGGSDLFLAKYSNSGVLQWVSVAGGLGDDIANQVVADNHNNNYVLCNITCCGGGVATFGTKSFNNASSWGGVVAKADQNGDWKWVNGMGTSAVEGMACGIIDDSSYVYVFGHFSGNSTFTSSPPGSTITLNPIGAFDFALSKLDSNGLLIWSKVYGGTGDDVAWDMCFYNNNILFAGNFSGTANFNGVSLTSYGSGDAFLCEVNKNGVGLNAVKMGSTGNDRCYSIDIDNAGSIYAAGEFTNTATFAPFTISGSGGTESFICKIAPITPFLFGPTAILCKSDSVHIYPQFQQLGVTRQWLKNNIVIPGETSDSLWVKTTGSYRLVYTNSCNESDSSQPLNITLDSVIANTGIDTTICKWDSVRLTATGGTSYQWSPTTAISNPAISNPYVNPNSTTNYICKVTKATCSAYDTVKVNVYVVNANAGLDTIVCKGDSIQLNATGGVTYAWIPKTNLSDSSISNPNVKPDTSRQYIVFVNDGVCINRDTIMVNVPYITIDAGSDKTICPGDSVQMQASTNSIFHWSPITGLTDTNSLNTFAKPIASTKYFLEGIKSGCSLSDSVTIIVSSNLPSGLTGDKTLCFGDSVRLILNTATSYLWSPGKGLSDSTSGSPYAKPEDTTNYIVQFITGGCVNYDTVTVNIVKIPANAGSDLNVCKGDSAQLQATGGNFYFWRPSNGLSNAFVSNPYVKPGIAMTYIVEVTSSGCTRSDSIEIGIDSVLVDAGIDLDICPGDSILIPASGTGIYSWTPVTGLNDPALLQPYAKPAISTVYTLAINDGTCIGRDSVSVNIKTLVPVSAGPDKQVCLGDSVQLNGSNSVNYYWRPNIAISDTLVQDPLVAPSVGMNYIVRGESLGCYVYDTVFVTVNPNPEISITDTLLCLNSVATLNCVVTGADTYLWTPGYGLSDPSIMNPNVYVSSDTVYHILATNSLTGCSAQDSMQLKYDRITADFERNPVSGFIPVNIVFTNKSTGANSYYWLFDSTTIPWSTETNPSMEFYGAGLYRIMLISTSNAGCTDTAYKDIEVFEGQKIFIPNVFTPNGDSINDLFTLSILSPGLIKQLKGSIWNRWGGLIYEFKMPGGSWWDGTFEGELCSQGVYFYIIEVEDIFRKTTRYHGTVTLLR